MYNSRNEYDRGVNTFSPQGRLFQVEYALGAVKLGSTSIGITTKEGVLLATERRVQSKLMEPKGDVEKLRRIDKHLTCASAGIIADSRVLIEHARVECQQHRFTYDEPMPVASCVGAIADLALSFSAVHDSKNRSVARPFGVALLVGGVDDSGPALWNVDPSGTITEFKAAAIGGAQEGSEALLHEQYNSEMTLKEAENLALLVLRQAMEEPLRSTNVEVCAVPIKTKEVCQYDTSQIEQIISRLPPATTV